MKTNEDGFTLVEVLVALVIFSIGFLATAKMQWMSIRGTTTSRGVTEASILAQSKVDELRMRPWTDLTIAGNDNLLGNPDTMTEVIATDGQDPPVTTYGNVYTVKWNIVDDVPVANARTVRVFVLWNDNGQPKRLFMDFIRNEIY